MNSHTRRRDDRAAPPDPYKQWIPTPDKYPPDHDADRRRNRSATLPAHSYDPRAYPSHDTRYNDTRQPSRSHRQDPHHPSASSSYHHPSAHAPSTSKTYQHATRPSAQHSSSYHHQPSSYQPSHPAPPYPVASSSRRPHPEAPDPRASRRPAPSTHQPPYDQVPGGEETARASARPSRAPHSSMQPSLSAPPNPAFWNPSQEVSSSRRPKDPYRERDRGQERDRERDREKDRQRERDRDRDRPAELENKYKDRTRGERERTTEARHQEPSKPRHHDRRKDSDTEGVVYSEQRNASKASLSGREGYASSVRESANGHKRHRTEDGTASTVSFGHSLYSPISHPSRQ